MTHGSRSARWLFFTLALFARPHVVRAQNGRVGTEFQVNTYTTGGQNDASAAMAANGDFVVTWTGGNSEDGFSYGIFFQRFSSSGTPLGLEFQVNEYTTFSQNMPWAASEASGDFIVVWRSANQDGATGGGIFARRFSSAGATVQGEFQVNAYTSFNQYRPAVAADSDGDFVITWGSENQDGASYGIFARRFSSGGLGLGGEFRVNTYTPGAQNNPAVAMDADGDFVISWYSNGQDGSYGGIFGQRFSSDGAALATEFQVNTYTVGSQYHPPSVAARANGDFVVSWMSNAQDGASYGVFARRFSSAGSPLAVEFQVNTYTPSAQTSPSVAVDASGDFVIAWESLTQDGSLHGVFARRFSSAGTALAQEFQVNTYTTNFQAFPSVASDGAGNLVIAWRSDVQDGEVSGVFAQRFAKPTLAAIDIDGDGSVDPLSDGLLILRFLFGFTGSTLTSGALDTQSCSRCDDGAIASYLASIQAQLDVDDDGETTALTDGLLILRYLFGFTGTTLTTGATDVDCMRCDASDIVDYLDALL